MRTLLALSLALSPSLALGAPTSRNATPEAGCVRYATQDKLEITLCNGKLRSVYNYRNAKETVWDNAGNQKHYEAGVEVQPKPTKNSKK